MPQRVTITFHPVHKHLRVPAGTTVLEAAERLELSIDSSCGGQGTCGKCRVRLLEGEEEFSPPELEHLSPEERSQGIRLACCLSITSPLTVELLNVYVIPSAKLKILGRERAGEVKSEVQRHVVRLSPPLLGEHRSLWAAIETRLPTTYRLNPRVLAALPASLWFQQETLTITTFGDQLLDIEAGDTPEQCYGVAIDIGTTTLAAYLLDLRSGHLLASAAKANGQQRYGADVVSRIKFAQEREEGRIRLQRRLLADLNHLIASLCHEVQIDRAHVYRLVLVGNTAMFHFFFGLDPYSLGTAPYIPLWDGEATFSAQELGIAVNRHAVGTFLPPLAGFVGSDTLA
ncbi:MAG: DUF4445 domain-containing protein, partial [Nitrospinota bacterium]